MSVSAYTSILKIRSEAGLRPEMEWREELEQGDGSRVVFDLGYVGRDKRDWVVSRDQLGSVAEIDVDVFLNDSATREADANYTLDEEEGIITFATAPTSGHNVHCTYWHSLIGDAEITNDCIPYAMDLIDNETGQSFYTGSDTLETYTEYWDGDSEQTSFRLSRGRITAVDSYIIDTATTGYTENTDYYLYPREHRIVFETPPSSDHKNVSITYSYGTPINETVKKLATYIAAKAAIKMSVGRMGLTGATTGTGSRRGYKDSNRFVTQIKLINEEILMMFRKLGCKIRVEKI